jgi:hypothetical protein
MIFTSFDAQPNCVQTLLEQLLYIKTVFVFENRTKVKANFFLLSEGTSC